MESISRRSLLKAAGGIVAAAGAMTGGSLFLDGCAPAVNTGATKTLNFWAFTDTRIAWQKKAWEMYKKEKNPDFEINWVIFPYQQMHDKILITAQAQSGGPDIADIEISQFARFIKGDIIFADLTPKIQQMGLLDKMYRPSATDPWSWQGKIYGIGNELNTCLLSYRWDLWQKAGVKVPIDSWDQLAEEAKRYHQDTGKYLISFAAQDWGHWFLQTQQQKGGFFNERGEPTMNSAQGIKTLAYQQQAMRDGWATARPIADVAFYSALGEGSIGSLIGASWSFSGGVQENIPDSKGKWHLQPLPYWEPGGSRTGTLGGTGVSVLKTSPNVEEAIDFVLYEHSTSQALLQDFSIRQVWPTYRPAFDDPVLGQALAFFDNQQVGALIKEMSPEMNPWYNSPFWPEATSTCVRLGITPALQQTNISPQDALTAAQEETKRTIAFESA
ncbi:MAG: extracellular solute-binding protein [Ktedonobacteraceae bacterium]|nr:extracellular solute-binding protein [Ktedonobacteraceae bacterium]MBO0789332.1 extracellular solute-binding protein [Ktedonobacteraceae bacterium]